MILSRFISGLALGVFGIILIVVAFANSLKNGSFIALIYGVPALVLGIVILLYRNEDKIEQIKNTRRKNE